jgi:hypothetical protein
MSFDIFPVLDVFLDKATLQMYNKLYSFNSIVSP